MDSDGADRRSGSWVRVDGIVIIRRRNVRRDIYDEYIYIYLRRSIRPEYIYQFFSSLIRSDYTTTVQCTYITRYQA